MTALALTKAVAWIPVSKELIFDGPPPVACWPTWADAESTPMWRFKDEVWYVPPMYAALGLTSPIHAMDLSAWTDEELAEWTGEGLEMREDRIGLFPLPRWFTNFVFRLLGERDVEAEELGEWDD